MKGDDAHALVSVIRFDTPESIYSNLNGRNAREIWKYSNLYVSSLLDGDDEDIKEIREGEKIRECREGIGMDTYKEIQNMLSREYIFIPLFRRGIPVTYTTDLDTKSTLRVTTKSLLYGPDVVHWDLNNRRLLMIYTCH